jgi:hypothetical protein
MGEVVQLFPEPPKDLKLGDLVWLGRFATFGTILSIERTGVAQIAMKGATVRLHLIRNREEIYTAQEARLIGAGQSGS